jgi:hypothetical protein
MKMNKKITLEVLDERLANFFRENKEDHNSIIEQTTKTNGRVNKHDLWLNRMIGGLILTEIILIPLAIYIITKAI